MFWLTAMVSSKNPVITLVRIPNSKDKPSIMALRNYEEGDHMDNFKVESAVIRMNKVSVMLDMMNETCIDGGEVGEKAEAAFLILKDLFDSCYSELRAALGR